jgi:hypothetical protein
MSARERLPNRRRCESFEFEHAGLAFTMTAGFCLDGRVAEIFLSSNKPGSLIEAIARDAAVTVSIALQFGADLETIRARSPRITTGARRRCWALPSMHCSPGRRYRHESDASPFAIDGRQESAPTQGPESAPA